jgi:hypothetical protein
MTAHSLPDLSSKRLSEVDLKCLYLERLRRLNLIDETSIIASEYSLGRTGRRADLAILNGEFIGIEFKSRHDSLKRLTQQLDAYVQCFDRVLLVADERHVENAQRLIPTPVELWSVNGGGELSLVKKPEAIKGNHSARVLAQLCTIRQLRKLVQNDKTPAWSRSMLTDAVLQLPPNHVYQAALATFRTAFTRSSAAFWSGLDARAGVDCNALRPLSRFAKVRQQQTLALKTQSDFWAAWAEEAATALGSQWSSVSAAI